MRFYVKKKTRFLTIKCHECHSGPGSWTRTHVDTRQGNTEVPAKCSVCFYWNLTKTKHSNKQKLTS